MSSKPMPYAYALAKGFEPKDAPVPWRGAGKKLVLYRYYNGIYPLVVIYHPISPYSLIYS